MATNNTDNSQKMSGFTAAFKSPVNPPTIPSAERGNNIIGPATYTPINSGNSISGNSGTAAQWSKRSQIRKLDENPQFKLNYDTPGPQQYEIEPTKQTLYYRDNRGKFLAEERFKVLPISLVSTPSNVGPGRYNINAVKKDKQYHSTAGFGASADRDYGSCLISHNYGPGPGQYTVKQDTTTQGHTILSDKILEKSQKLKGLGVSFKPSASVDPASIPSPARAKNPIGPAYYTPILQKNSRTAAQWSKRSERRNLDENPQFKLNYATPGPQHYEIEPNTEVRFYEDSIGKFLAEPRFKECQNKKRRHPNAGTQTPAPVAYALPRFGDATGKTESSAFKSGTKRFQQKETGVPAATTYTCNGEMVQNKSFRIYREKAPFESGATRFDAKKFQNYQHLGPSTYVGNTNTQSLAMQSKKDANVKKTVKGGFGSTEATQKRLIQDVGDISYPGPCNYHVTEKPHKSEKSFSMAGSSSFSSTSHRMIKIGNERPAPWDYNITQYAIGTKLGNPNKARHFKRAFNSSISRKANEQNHNHNTDVTPSPASYEIMNPPRVHQEVPSWYNIPNHSKSPGWHK